MKYTEPSKDGETAKMSKLTFVKTLLTVCCLNKLAVIGTNSIRKDLVSRKLVGEECAYKMSLGDIRTLIQNDSNSQDKDKKKPK